MPDFPVSAVFIFKYDVLLVCCDFCHCQPPMPRVKTVVLSPTNVENHQWTWVLSSGSDGVRYPVDSCKLCDHWPKLWNVTKRLKSWQFAKFSNMWYEWNLNSIRPIRPRRTRWWQWRALVRSSLSRNSCAHRVLSAFLGDFRPFEPPRPRVIWPVLGPNLIEVRQGTLGATFKVASVRFWALLHDKHDHDYVHLYVHVYPYTMKVWSVPLCRGVMKCYYLWLGLLSAILCDPKP